MASEEREVSIVIRGKNLTAAEFDAARKGLAGLGDETEKTTQKTKKGSDGLGVFEGSWRQLVGAFALGNIAANTVGKLADEVWTFIGNSESFPDVQRSFSNLTKSIGSNADEMLASMRKASRGMVSDYDLMLTANKAMLLGLPVTADEMGKLTGAAITLGRAMGLSAAESVNKLITALSRNSKLILDDLGLKVDLAKANEEYAASINSSADALTDEQKSLAFYTAAVKAADEALVKVRGTTEDNITFTQGWGQVWTSVGNLITGVLGGLNSELGKLALDEKKNSQLVLSSRSEALAHYYEQRKATDAQVAATERETAANREAANVVAESVDTRRDYVAALAEAKAKLKDLEPSVKTQIAAALEMGESTKKVNEQYKVGEVVIDLFKKQLQEQAQQEKKTADEIAKRDEALQRIKMASVKLTDAQRDQVVSLKELGISEADIATALKVTAEQVKRTLEIEKQRADQHAFIEGMMSKADAQAAKTLKDRTNVWEASYAKQAASSAKYLSDTLSGAQAAGEAYLDIIRTNEEKELAAAAHKRDELLKGIEGLKTTMPAQYELARQQILFVYDRMVEDVRQTTQRQMSIWQQSMAALPSVLINAIASGNNPAQAIADHFGASLFGDNGPISSVMFKGLDKVASFMPDWLTQGIANAIPGLGPLVAPVIEKGLGFVTGLFGKVFGSAGRDSVKEFAASMGGFDALRAKLLPLGDEGERLWKNLTQGVGKNNPKQAQAAIEAITSALERQQGVIADEANLLASTQLSWKDAEDLVAKYGITVTNSGKALEQSKMNEQAEDLATNWRKLVLAGLDVTEVTAGMADEAQEFLNRSFQFGLDVPESMRKMLQPMVDAGLLLDANGEKMTDLSSIEFSTTPIDKLISKLDELLSKMFGIGDAADDSKKKAQQAFHGLADDAKDASTRITQLFDDLSFEIPVKFGDLPEAPGGGGGTAARPSLTSEGFASGGIAYGPMLARIEPGRKEIIGDVTFMTQAVAGAMERLGMNRSGGAQSGGAGIPMVLHVHNYIGDHELEPMIVEIGQNALQGGRWQVPRDAIAGRAR